MASPAGDSPFIFISYCHQDVEHAARIAERLKEANIPSYVDRNELKLGEQIEEAVFEAMQRSTHLVVIVSRSIGDSSWVPYEAGLARALGIP